MALPHILSPTDKEPKLFLGIRLTDTTVQSVLWRIEKSAIQIEKVSQVHSYQTQESCINQTDESFQELGSKSEAADQVLFGLEPKWVNNGDVVEAKKPILQRLTKDFSMQPVGFVSIPETIAQHFAVNEPLFSAIVIELSEQNLRLSLILRGQLSDYQEVGKSGDIVADVREALARCEQELGQEHLPPKILLFSDYASQDEIKSQQQLLLGFDWVKEHHFLSSPMVETSNENLAVQAMILSGGKAVANSLGFKLTEPKPEQVVSISDDFGFSNALSEPTPLPELKPLHDDNLTAVSDEVTANLGVVLDQDLAIKPESPKNQLPVHKPKKKFSLKLPSFKFWPKKKSGQPKLAISDHQSVHLEHQDHLDHLDKPNKKISHRPFILGGFAGGLVVLLIIGWLAAGQVSKATVEIRLKAKTVSKDAQLILDPKVSSPDAEKLVLPATIQKKSVSSNKTIDTTGVKLIGDKAKGTITIYNKTDGEKTFDKGTILSSGKFSFVLDDQVKVASASSSTTTTVHGKADGTVVAQEIGADSNLAKDTELKIADFSSNSYVATIKEGLSGGSSREVRVVSKEDVTTLKSELIKQLLQIAQKEYKDDETGGIYFITTGKYSQAKTEYDAEEGDEVSTLTLNMTLDVEAMSYQGSDLKPLADGLLKSEVSAGYQLISSDPQILSSPVETASSSTQVRLDTQVSSQIVPIVDIEEIKQALQGKKIPKAQEYLTSSQNIANFSITIQPKILGKIYPYLPAKKANITVEIK